MRHSLGLAPLFLLLASLSSVGYAEEGMWTFNNLPLKALEQQYAFKPTDAWLTHVMRASLRFSSGGSGSFLSASGLVLTNHHVAESVLHDISTSEKDYMRDGFYAAEAKDEVKAPGLYVDSLVEITDVSARVKSAMDKQSTDEGRNNARNAEVDVIQNEVKQNGLIGEVVTLYRGGQYQLYKYKRYDDLRIVFAPEFAIAFFGGDPENFEFPRYDLDMAIFRAYENGKPAVIEHYLKVASEGIREGDLAFVTGNPGTTERMLTVEALKTQAHTNLPSILERLRATEKALIGFSQLGAENERRAHAALFGVQNSIKVIAGRLSGLTPTVLKQKQSAEERLQAEIAKRPELKKTASAWKTISAIEKQYRKNFKRYALMSGQLGSVLGLAQTLVRAADEDKKPDADRLPEYTAYRRPALLQKLLAKSQIYPDLEEVSLANTLEIYQKNLPRDPVVKLLLAGKKPRARAKELLAHTQLFSADFRKDVYDRGAAGIAAAKNDSLIALALAVDPEFRSVRKEFETKITGPSQSAYGLIAQAQFKIDGTSAYPDATFSPRLSYGRVAGYVANGQKVAATTTIGGAFIHEKEMGAVAPYKLPESWHKAQPKASVPFDFVSTNDIIGGNSGSPVINARGELAGLIFDGNRESLVGDFFYDSTANRAISVHADAMLEALKEIYHARKLVTELESK